MKEKFKWRSYHAHFATTSIFLLLDPLDIYLSDVEYWVYYFAVPTIWVTLSYIDKNNPNALKVHSLAFILFSIFSTAYIQVIENSFNESSLIFLVSFFVTISLLTSSSIHLSKPLLKKLIIALWSTIILASYLLTIIYIANGPITKETVFAVLQTHSRESLDFLINVFSEPLLYLSTLIAVCLLLVVRQLLDNARAVQGTKVNLSLIILAAGLATTQLHGKAFAGILSIEKNIEIYFKEIEKLKKVVARRSNQVQNNNTIVKPKTGEIHVLVLGESLSSYHMSTYGYALETTPWISATATEHFENARANHTHTMRTLSKALTESNQYNGKDYYESESIISVAKKAGFKTAWISNQVSLGAWDNLVSVIAQESDYYKFINKDIGKTTATQFLDEYLVTALSGYLESIDPAENHFIVIHMMGSHWQYCDRTRGANIQLPKLPNYIYLDKHNVCYDKSVKYADHVLKQIHNTLLTQENFTSLLFTSDHGDDVFGKKKHNSAFFTEHMTDIPLVFWAGNRFGTDRLTNLQANKNAYFTNDLLFDTLVGIMDIESDSYSARYDLSSPHYIDLLQDGTVLHGKTKLSALASLVSRHNVQEYKKLMAHRVNTVGALGDAKKQHFNAIEFDVVYDEARQKIVMGHGKKALTGQTFNEYLRYENGQFDRLWIDFKNLTETNIDDISKALDALDREFDLKSRALLESGIKSPLFSRLSEQGWETSYYLPTKKILELIKSNEKAHSVKQANKIIQQVQAQKIRSLSFDSRLFPFVDKYLFPALNQDIRLNTWTNLSTDRNNFSKRFEKLKIAKDERIDSIIVRHVTRFKM